MKIAIIYWSGTGNTESMADALYDSLIEAGQEVEEFVVSDFDPETVSLYDCLALGCSSQGDEELEESEFLPVYEQIKPQLAGKKIILFGSYGWGDGEWMRNWQEEIEQFGATLLCDPIITQEELSDAAKTELENIKDLL